MPPKVLIVALMVASVSASAAGCGGGGSPAPASLGQPSATATQAGPDVAPTPTEVPWNPIYGYDPGTSTGVPAVDAVMAAISALDLDALVALAVSKPVSCAAAATPSPSAHRCPPGTDAGTLLSVVGAEFCSGAVSFPMAEARAIFRPLLDGLPRLWGLRELPPGTPSSKRPGAPPARYVLFVVNNTDPPTSFTLILGADGSIQSVGYGCGERPEKVWTGWSSTGTALLSPPLAPRPR